MDATRIDIEQAQLFLDTLAPEGLLTFQVIPERADVKGKQQAKILHGNLNAHSRTLIENNLAGYGIFVMVNEGDGIGRKASNVLSVRAYCVDLDGVPVDPVLESGYSPHILVESSPGKWHAYWLAADCPLDQFKVRQQTLAARFSGDPSVCDLPRVMRVPGFYHQKGDPFVTRLVWPAIEKQEGCRHD